MDMIETIRGVNGILPLTLPEQSARVQIKKSCCPKGSGKEPVMMNRTSTGIAQPVMGFCYYCYFKACYFAGLFRRAVIPYLPDVS